MECFVGWCVFFFVPFKTTKEKKTTTRDDGQGSTHVLGFRRTCCYGNAGCVALEVRHPACEVTGVQQLLHCVVWPQRMHARSVARAHGPPTLHTPTAFHKSTSSSPTRGGSGPGRLSSLPRFLLTKQKTKVKSVQCWHSPEPAPPGPKLFTQPLLDSLPLFSRLDTIFSFFLSFF